MVGKKGRARLISLLCAWLALQAAGDAQAAPLAASQADRLRIQRHLAGVEHDLRLAPVEHLAPTARVARARLLDELHQYWRAGVFPRNSGHLNQLRPYFIDDEGRPCAVGALIQRSGHEQLAARIDAEFHTNYVPDMGDAELLAWAVAHGFSLAELARIQPSYCACGTGWDGEGGAGGMAAEEAAAYDPVCGSDGLTYWNTCVAELCGDATVVATGECEHEAPCELCGTGTDYVAISECTRHDAPTGLCELPATPGVVAVSDVVATRWLEMQQRDCQDPDYDLTEGESPEWQPTNPPGPDPAARWDCTNEGGRASAGAPAISAGSPNEPSARGGEGGTSNEPNAGSPSADPTTSTPSEGCGCNVAASNSRAGTLAALLALLALRRRSRR